MVTAIVEIVSPQIHKTSAEASNKICGDYSNLQDQPLHDAHPLRITTV